MPLIRGQGPIDTIDELRSLSATLIDQEQATLFRSSAGAEVACRAGCTACCNQPVPVGPAELRAINQALDALPAPVRHRVRRAIADRASQLRSLGFDADDLNRSAGDTRQKVIEHYFAAAVPCPLLDGDTCVVREARPLTCRDYLVTSDPEHCESLPSEQIVRVRLGRDVLTNYARVESSIGDRGMSILALALAESPAPSAPLEPRSHSSAVRDLTAPTVETAAITPPA